MAPLELGQRLRSLRARRRLSQRALAEPRYDGSFVSQIEAGRRSPSADALAYFAARLGVSVEELASPIPPSAKLELEMALAEAVERFAEGKLSAAADGFRRLGDLAETLGAADHQVEAAMGLGHIDELAGSVEAALDRYHAAEALPATSPVITRLRIALGRAYRTAGDYSYAIDLTEGALAFARENGWPELAVRAAVQLASTYSDRGDYARSARVLASVADEERLSSDPRALGALHWARARASAALGRPEEALRHITEARALYRQVDAAIENARLEGARAYHLLEAGRPAEAAPVFEESIVALRASGASLEAARLQTELARAELAAGRRERAREIAEEALEILRGLQDPVEEGQAALALALALGSEPRAETLLHLARDRFAEHGAKEQLARALQALGEFYVMAGRQQEALESFRRAVAAVVA